jgi:hypothetical protein
MTEVNCPYCNKLTMLVKGKTIYPHRKDLHDRYYYLCRPCNAYVGCHRGTTHPLGVPASPEVRKARSAAHAAFDPLWQGKSMKRKAVYQWMADHLGIPVEDCHIGNFDVETCRKVVKICAEGKDMP